MQITFDNVQCVDEFYVPEEDALYLLQLSEAFSLNRNAIFSLSSNAVLPLENPLNVLKCFIYTNLMSL